MTPPRLCVVGMATRDTLLSLQNRPEKASSPHPVTEAIECPGGKGVVAAVAAAHAGAEVELWARTGRDWEATDDHVKVSVRSELQTSHLSSRTWNLLVDGVDVQTFVYEMPERPLDRLGPSYSALRKSLNVADGVILTTERSAWIHRAGSCRM